MATANNTAVFYSDSNKLEGIWLIAWLRRNKINAERAVTAQSSYKYLILLLSRALLADKTALNGFIEACGNSKILVFSIDGTEADETLKNHLVNALFYDGSDMDAAADKIYKELCNGLNVSCAPIAKRNPLELDENRVRELLDYDEKIIPLTFKALLLSLYNDYISSYTLTIYSNSGMLDKSKQALDDLLQCGLVRKASSEKDYMFLPLISKEGIYQLIHDTLNDKLQPLLTYKLIGAWKCTNSKDCKCFVFQLYNDHLIDKSGDFVVFEFLNNNCFILECGGKTFTNGRFDVNEDFRLSTSIVHQGFTFEIVENAEVAITDGNLSIFFGGEYRMFYPFER